MADRPTTVPATKKIGTHGYAGVLNGLGAVAIFRRRTNTAPTAKINAALGWEPERSLEDILGDVIAFERGRVANAV